jgi:hypothetical protein
MPGRKASRVDTAPADAAIDKHLDLGIDPFVGTAEDTQRQRARHQQVRRHARVAAAVRRRRIMLGLSVVATLAVLGTVLGMTPLPLAAAVVGAWGGYGYLLRSQSAARARASAASRQRQARTTATDSADDVRDTWEPVRSPEPSYMRAPRATAVPREIDSDQNGPWTAERMLEQAAALRSGQDDEADLGLDEYAYPHEYQTARAVNE